MQTRFQAEVRSKQSWQQAWAAMMVGGLARLPHWVPGAFYKFEDGVGLSLVTGGHSYKMQSPLPFEVEATDWLVVVPMEGELLAAPPVEIGGIDFVAARDQQEDVALAEHIEAEQAAAQEECDCIVNQDFAAAMADVLDGTAVAYRDVVGYGIVMLAQFPASGERFLALIDNADGSLVGAFLPTPEDMVADDWVIQFEG